MRCSAFTDIRPSICGNTCYWVGIQNREKLLRNVYFNCVLVASSRDVDPCAREQET